ncbi:glycosyltransferase [Methanobacterium aggregans]|uniref:glycosyltransferase n=1 Tax=Methanobacterium aggregans TaxID=1615586 RepID=UPI001AE35571|nr:glycosyltransferase [Methanobacterium aggregans]MBP2047067.1 glycosyltransferase involved in cell wall biosynthesis [Methanobacterium aggregans]
MNSEPLVSVVVPVLNSEKTLKKCLNSVLNQSYGNIEVIVVDGGSNDRTVEIAQKLGAKVVDANVPSMTKQTNMGIINSQGKYIYRIDSDVILPGNMVEECVEKCEVEGYDGVCVFWLPDKSISFWAKVRRIEKESYVKTPNCVGSIKYDKNVLGARFLRRDVFDAVGGFDEGISTIGEDYALYNKLARSDFNFALIKSREKHVGEPRRIQDIIQKNFRYGTALMQFSDNQKEGTKQFSPAGRTYLIKAFETAFKNNLTLFFGLMIYLFAVYTSTATGIVYYKFTMQTKRLA